MLSLSFSVAAGGDCASLCGPLQPVHFAQGVIAARSPTSDYPVVGDPAFREWDNVLYVTWGCSCSLRDPYGAVAAGAFRSLGSCVGRFSGRPSAASLVSVASVDVWGI